MIPVFCGETANEVWRKAAEELLSEDISTIDSRAGNTHEFLHAVFSISNPRERWVTDRNPAVSIAFALAEVVWILNGSSESRIINYWNPLLKRYAGGDEFYHGAYGYRIRERYGIDQLDRAYHALKSNPNNRQTVILIWNPNDDIPQTTGAPTNPDIPCNICSLLKIRDSKLEWTQIIRSNDIFRGVPYNFIQFTSIQEIMAGWLGIEVGTYTQFSDSLHLYEDDTEQLSIVRRDHERNSDNLVLPKQESEKVLGEIFDRMNVISASIASKENLKSLGYLDSGYEAYDNIMLIIAAYAAKKLEHKELSYHFIDSCTNPLLCQMWEDWAKQFK